MGRPEFSEKLVDRHRYKISFIALTAAFIAVLAENGALQSRPQ
jgi:hypothetical protein